MMTDPVADMLARIRNAGVARHPDTTCPSSRLKLAIARVLKEEGFIEDVTLEPNEGKPQLRITLRYNAEGRMIIDGLRRVSKPSRRVYVGAKQLPKVRNGLGVAVLSTPKGVITDDAAREQAVGGEFMCEVW
ncbi:MAG: 30S ribosomal protein S8 [Deltaproteobacteria bacterium]|jgi:small subunit ribosomal protein S8|nr:30S ribosomal protein S8 [Deltaproteobacteria bacterium]